LSSAWSFRDSAIDLGGGVSRNWTARERSSGFEVIFIFLFLFLFFRGLGMGWQMDRQPLPRQDAGAVVMVVVCVLTECAGKP
jgi:hypothetical protein